MKDEPKMSKTYKEIDGRVSTACKDSEGRQDTSEAEGLRMKVVDSEYRT